MNARAGSAAVALLLVLTACGGNDGPDGTPGAQSPGESPSASTGADGPSASASAAGDVKQLFKAALEPLLGEPVIDFREDVYSGQALAIETRGRAFQQVGWQARTTSPKQLGSHDAPEGDEIKGSMDVRAFDADLYMQLSTWSAPLAGCWLRTGSGQVPGGQLAMTPGVPGYITLLGELRPQVIVEDDGPTIVIGADVPLRIGLQLLTTGVLGLLQLDASQLDGATIPIGVKVTDGVVTDAELLGPDLVSAVRAAGGDVKADAEVTLQQLQVRIAYKSGPADAPKVTAPSQELVMSAADARSGRGC
jgi:hypothetical protein